MMMWISCCVCLIKYSSAAEMHQNEATDLGRSRDLCCIAQRSLSVWLCPATKMQYKITFCLLLKILWNC